tara:strand:+ start:3684 stop:4433 length:750 start_codon:yes stop_codon:yes gene_type:complete
MTDKIKLCIVIPCYNEEKRLDINRFSNFIATQKEVLVCFVNDGSTDNTLKILDNLKAKFPLNIETISMPKNVGKAEAVRMGFLHCNATFNHTKIAYLDADLATSLEECFEISEHLTDKIVVAFGSRIAKIDSTIDRKYYRFIIGRVIATFISRQLNLKVYDTQCGCKIFEREISKQLFSSEFISKWLFDVELFHRLIAIYGLDRMKFIAKEIPLKTWIDYDESKVKMTYFFKLWLDLYQIKKFYTKKTT